MRVNDLKKLNDCKETGLARPLRYPQDGSEMDL